MAQSGERLSGLKRISSWERHIPKGVEFLAGDLLEDESLPKSWVKALLEAPGRKLFCDVDGRWINREEFLARSHDAACAMHESGLIRGERILMSAAASIGYLVHYVAALRLGLVVVPMNTSYTKTEVFHIVGDVKPSAAIVDSDERAEWIVEAAKQPGCLTPFIGPGADLPLPSGDIQVYFAEKSHARGADFAAQLDMAESGDPALIAYTSGTTGRPKGAILTHGNLLASAKSLNMVWRWDERDRLVLALPLFHMHGLGVGVNGTLCAGSSAVLSDRFDPEKVCQAVTDHSASMFFGVPTMYQRLLESESLEPLRSLRLMVSGSAPLSREIHRAIEERCGQTVLERYGTTESLIDISNPFEGERIAGKVGFPLPGVEAAISSESSELFISGPTVFSGYLNDPVATAAAFPNGDGWFATGDVGEIDERGYVAIAGRLKELIISGGYNVYPKEVEEVLRSHPAVRDAAVVGVESARWGEEVVAFVVKGSDLREEELAAHASLHLANYKRPKRIFFVDEFPRNALGKVISAELRRTASSMR